MNALSFRIPLRFLRGNYTRLALSVVALACGVALVCAFDLVNRAVFRAFVEIIDTMAGRAALQVTAGEGALFPEEVAAEVAAVPGVELAVPVVSATAFVADESGELLTVHGVDIANDRAIRVYDARDADGLRIEDPLIFLSQPDSVVLTNAFAIRRGVAVGDRITLDTPTGRRPFTIRGLLEPQGVAKVYAGNLAVMDLYAAEAAFAHPGFINRVDVVVRPENDVATVANALAGTLPSGLRVGTPSQRKADLHRVMQSLQVLLSAMGFVGLLAAYLIAFNRLSAVFEGRAWQLGILRAGGVRARVVSRELLKESLLLGTVGVAIGIPVGIFLGRLLLPIVATTTALSYKLVAPDTKFSVGPFSLLSATVLGLAAALLAAAYPASRAARRAAIETLAGRGLEQPGNARWTIHILLWTTVGCVLAAILLQSVTRLPTWGLLATGLIALGTALAARPLVDFLGLLVLPVLRARAGATTWFAVAMVAHNPRRSALTVATLGVGVGAVLWLWTVGYSFERSVISALAPAMHADLVVGSAHVESGAFEAPINDGLIAELKEVPGVNAVVGERVTDWHHAGGPIVVEAFDPEYFASAQMGRWPLLNRYLPDAWEIVGRGEGTVVSSNFALNVRATVGDTVILETPSGPLSLQITGITMDFASPRGTMKVSRVLYRKFWHDHQITLAFVHIDPGSNILDVRAAISRMLGDTYGLRLLSSAELIDYYAKQVRKAFGAVDVLAVMVLFVLLVGVADTLAAGVVDRTREVGAVRALGVRRRHVRRMVLLEGLTLASLGLVLAASAGFALGTLWVDATFPYLLGWLLEMHVPYGRAGTAALVSVVVSLIAAILPARRAAALEPAVALRYE